jgi:hypothetical protein
MFSFAKTNAIDGLLFDNKMRLKPLFLCRRYFFNGAGYTNTNAFVSQTLTHLDRKNVGGIQLWIPNHQYDKGSFSAGYGQFTYDSNPNVSINNDAVALLKIQIRHSILELRF